MIFSPMPSILVPALVDTARPMLADCQKSIAAIAALVPPHQFWRSSCLSMFLVIPLLTKIIQVEKHMAATGNDLRAIFPCSLC